MKRVPTYRGLTLNQMSKTDLRMRLETNRDRLRVRAWIMGLLGAVTLCVHPAAGIFVLAVGSLTSWWLLQNNKALRLALTERDA
ncbi:MAG: hypothetical protein IKP10_01265 [Clostridia bacterium]|nr:hypothetical protein [Clostridia bacterium]